MKHPLLTLLLMTMTGLTARSQNDQPVAPPSIQIHIVPSSMADYSPRLRMGTEITVDKRWGFSLDAGYGNYLLGQERLSGKATGRDYSLFEIRPEFKYHFARPRHNVSFYTALEGFFITMTDRVKDSYFNESGTSNYVYFDYATYHYEKTGLHLKLGWKIVAFHRMPFDIYMGVGTANRNVRYSELVNARNSTFHDDFFDILNPLHKNPGNNEFINLALGFKIGWVLNPEK